MTERELVAIAASTMYASGDITTGTKPTFLNCVSGRDRYALVDTTASDRPLAEGDVVFLDGGGAGDGYMSDIIRLIAVGAISDGGGAVRRDRPHGARRRGRRASGRAPACPSCSRPARPSSTRPGWEGPAGACPGTASAWSSGSVRSSATTPVIRSRTWRCRPGMTLSLEPILMPRDDAGVVGVFVFENQVAVTADGVEVLSGDLETRLWRAPA